jgi:hypothetical protein
MCPLLFATFMHVSATENKMQCGPYSKEELEVLDRAIKKYAEKLGLSTNNFE